MPKQVNEFKKLTAQEILTAVVPDTPVKSGRARSNYVVGIGRKNPFINDDIDLKGDVSLIRGFEAIRTAKPGEAIHINNNLAYIGRLNDGYSAQAPAGFIQKAAARGRALVRRQKIRFLANG